MYKKFSPGGVRDKGNQSVIDIIIPIIYQLWAQISLDLLFCESRLYDLVALSLIEKIPHRSCILKICLAFYLFLI
jgi:hypothetical protein